ncbi:MAG: MotA/TolQ/ExbB proton channel family protein [Myxococcota bacterium]|nr:MotA/TolQ/ExbB proton channel family protein [Myxococcota bacterium]
MIEFLVSGGPVMIPIGLASIVGFAAFLERLFALRRSRVVSRDFAVEVEELLKQQRWADALTLCRKSDTAVARVVEVAVLARGEQRPSIKERLEEVGRREAAELERYSQVLGTVANVAPLLGLLGTVWGMILTFDVIQQEGVGVVSSLAGGISQALITTMAGLTVGIPALIGYRWVLARADSLILEMEEVSLTGLDLLAPTVKVDGEQTS